MSTPNLPAQPTDPVGPSASPHRPKASGGFLAGAIAKLRSLKTSERKSIRFKDLVDLEYRRLDQAKRRESESPLPAYTGSPLVAEPSIADEPWVCFTERDLFGVALSGGGIRSATFNLGLLQALERKRLLKEVDFVSTVSGGGYVGGFWTAWRQNNPAPAKGSTHEAQHYFPVQTNPATAKSREPIDTREPAPIRHLREFSRFLMPRLGFFHSETWDGIVAILGGIMPGLFAALAVLALLHYAWFLITLWLMALPALLSALGVAFLTFAIHVFAEESWRQSGKSGVTAQGAWHYRLLALIVSLGTGAMWLWLTHYQTSFERLQSDWLANVVATWWPAHPGGAMPPSTISLAPFGLSLVWAAMAIVLLFLRIFDAGIGERTAVIDRSAKFERAASRYFMSALIWSGFALVWEACHWLLAAHHRISAAGASGVVGGTSSALFIWLRDWLGKPVEETQGSSLFGKVAAQLKPLAPQLLANLAVLSLFFGVGLLLQDLGLGENYNYYIAGAVIVIGLTLLLFNPARTGMHDFYRSRLCRCYLGGARAQEEPAYRRFTVEQPTDDLTLGQLRDDAARQRPIHLVCSTANNLAGDVLGSLYRGGRSAVISPFGISLGDHAAPLDGLRLSSALTASAAAFNSQMGSLSMDLGPAVAFLMCAFNLRLGLWVPHPLNPGEKALCQGLPFFYEMFGRTNCDPAPVPPADTRTPPRPARAGPAGFIRRTGRQLSATCQQTGLAVDSATAYVNRRTHLLHLSDGGHFENLAVYELVRRHCRFIIASDAAADRELFFDDLANLQRRVREDFGVEIEIDVSPLRPDAAGRARQHAVVGTIHYDGFDGTDKGTLLYFKPALTGEEPPDVVQYQARHPSFPHESTGDQFYDEAQWESYRRLGEHAGNVVFRYLEKFPVDRAWRRQFVENTFLEATQRWNPAHDTQTEIFRAAEDRCAELDAAVRDGAPASLRAEFFPEIGYVLATAPVAPLTPDEETRVVYFLMQAAQVMEDTWLAADLETDWALPDNEGWMNYFQRWASTASFRRWWPVLRPIYSAGFRDFVRDRFQVIIKDDFAREEPPVPGAELTMTAMRATDDALHGYAWQQWTSRQGQPDPVDFARLSALDYRLTLTADRNGARGEPVQVGFLLFEHKKIGGIDCVQWHGKQLYVPYSLVGSGIVARLLEAAIKHFTGLGARRPAELRVLLDEDPSAGLGNAGPKAARHLRPDPGYRLQRVHNINFYKSRGFVYSSPAESAGAPRMLRLKLMD